MKNTLAPLRIVLGGLFIFSGLVKLNDPVGTAIKLEEYFEVFSESFSPLFHAFIPWALPMSLAFCVAEVVLGLAVLLRHRMRLTMWLMLLLIVFFTFLTFYSAYFDKVTDCGCFGDFVKLKPWTSFGKDVFLLVLTLVLLVYSNRMPNMLPRKQGDGILALASLLFGFVGYWAIVHLPYADWRPYKMGNHIPTQMKPSAAFQYRYVMEKDGKREEMEEYPTDTTYKFIEMEILNPEAAPKITDYRVWNDEADYTDSTFVGNKLLIIVRADDKIPAGEMAKINALVSGLGQAKPKVDAWVVTSLDRQRYEAFRHEAQLAAPYFYADATVLKTIMRTQIGTWLLKDGKVAGKWGLADTPTADEVRQSLAQD